MVRSRGSCIQSPDDLEAFVKVEGFVRRHDRNVFHEGLGDDLAVEGIGMMCGQIEEAEGMLCRVGKTRRRRSPTPASASALPNVSFPLKRNSGGFAPANPPTASLAGPPFAPLRSADSLASARSFHDDGVERSSVSNSYV